MAVLHVLQVRKIDEDNSGPSSRYIYEFRAADSPGPIEQDFPVDVNRSVVEAVASQLNDVVERSLQLADTAPIDHLAELRPAGNLLYKTLFPVLEGYLPDLVARLRDSREPLLIRTNESLVPWELLHDGEEFLGLKYEIGRQSVVQRRVGPGRPTGAIRRALLVADPLGDLPEALKEAEHLADWLGQQGVSCTLLSRSQANLLGVLSELTNPATGGYDLLHYSGHVAVHERTNESVLVLHQKQALDVRTIRAALTGGGPPVVFINGCRSADHLSNLCSAFMVTGSRTVVGTLHRISEAAARHVAELVYTRLMAGMAAGAALRETRELLSAGLDAAWASFVLFGDPTVRIWPIQATATSAEEVPPQVAIAVGQEAPLPGWAEGLDQEALSVLQEAVTSSRGLVSSLHLLEALLAVERSPLRKLAGRSRLDVDKLLAKLRTALAQGSPPDAGGNIGLSATVTRVLNSARQQAGRADRDLASLEDLVEAFARVGGGEAGKVLSYLGIPLGDLLPACERVSIVTDRPGSLFAQSGELLVEYLDSSTASALQAAALLSRSQGMMISTAGLLVGFGLSDSLVLREALLKQGKAGEEAVRQLYAGAQQHIPRLVKLRLEDFSARTYQAVERALRREREAGEPLVGDAAVLRELLREEESSVGQLLKSLDMDPVRLRLSLSPGRGSQEA